MNTHLDTNSWMQRIMVVLGLIVIVSAIVAIILLIMHEPVTDILLVPGLIAAVSLMRLLIPSLLI